MTDRSHDRDFEVGQQPSAGADEIGADTEPNSTWERPSPLSQTAEPPDFPTGLLPPWAGDYVVSLAEAMQVPGALPGMLVLACLAASAGGRVRVRIRQGWEVPTNIYLAVAMPPGSGKSPVFEAVARPIRRWQQRAIDRVQPDISGAAAQRRIADGLVRQAEAIVAKANPSDREHLTQEALARRRDADCIDVPVEPRLLIDDATPEAVATMLAEQEGRLALLSAEADVFGILAGRYSRTGMPHLSVFLKSWSGDELRIDRKARPSEYVERPALTIGLTVQPEVLRKVAEQPDFRGRGLLARFLFAVPESRVGWRMTDASPVPEAVENRYDDEMSALVTSLAELREVSSLELSPEAATAFAGFQARLEPRLREATGDLGHIADWGCKLPDEAARLAGLLHVARHPGRGLELPIQDETVKAAVTLAEAFLVPHAKAAFDLMGTDAELEGARYVGRWITQEEIKSFTRRQCHAAHRARFPKVAQLDPVLALLEDHSWIRPICRGPALGVAAHPAQPMSYTLTCSAQKQRNAE